MSLDQSIYHVVYGPHVTEKAVTNSGSNIHVFKVATNASKRQIKKAVESLFDVKVDNVRSVNVKGKSKNFGKRQGARKNWKKAYVRLADGQSINIEAEG